MAGYYAVYNDKYLMHHGVKGMKWGVRRYRNKNGSLTPKGKRRYSKFEKQAKEDAAKLDTALVENHKAALNYQTSGKQYMHVDEKGRPITGNIIRIANKGDDIIERKADKSLKAYNSIKESMKKKYDDVCVKGNFDYDTGKMTVEVILKKDGNELSSTVDTTFDIDYPKLNFLTYKSS